MVQMADDTVTLRGRQDVGHIPCQPLWLLIVRGFQLILAIIVLGLSAYSGGGCYFYPGYGFAIFTFVWTLLFLIYIEVTIFWFPGAYNKYAHLVLECMCVVFWLAAFAALAVVATYSWAISAVNSLVCGNNYFKRYYYPSSGNVVDYSSYENATKAAAALGAIEWALFICSLIAFGIFLHRHRMAEREARMGVAPGPAVEEHKMQPLVNQQPIDPRYQQQTYQQQMA